jgi:hypothetical protein
MSAKVRGAVGRRDLYPAVSGRKGVIHDQTEPKLVQIEPQASLLISNKNDDGVEMEVKGSADPGGPPDDRSKRAKKSPSA